jgi:D-aminopeptidase
MARTGADFSHGSGDYVIAFSTSESVRIAHESPTPTHTITVVHESEIDQLFDAVAEATEEAIYNSLFRATTVRGRDGNVAQALPLDDVKRILKNYGRGNR